MTTTILITLDDETYLTISEEAYNNDTVPAEIIKAMIESCLSEV